MSELDQALLRLLDYNGRRYRLAKGWSIRFRIALAPVTPQRPYGVRYALTLHDAAMMRLLGFDNAHGVPRREAFDHRHRFRRTAEMVPYDYVDADQLLVDFFDAVEAACRADGVPFTFDADDVEMEDTDGQDIPD